MNKRFLFITALVLFVIGVTSTNVFAQAPKPTGVQQTTPIATVNIYDARIISQEGRTLTLGFTLSNREGVQSGVRYSVQIVSDTGTKQALVDERIYDEELTLPANSSLSREITYTAPETIQGQYTVLIASSNASGFPFGIAIAGKPTFASATAGVGILAGTCSVNTTGVGSSNDPVALTRRIIVSPQQNLILGCTAVNYSKEEITVAPQIETFYRSAYGAPVEASGATDTTISFAPGERKTISLELPKATTPQAYTAHVSLGSAESKSNKVSVHYLIPGRTGTITNVSLDADHYNRNAAGMLDLVWMATFGTPKVRIEITNDHGKRCAAPIEVTLDAKKGPVESIPFSTTRSCFNPVVTAVLTDEEGQTLDTKEFFITSSVAEKTNVPWLSIVLGVVILGVIVFYLKKKKINTPIGALLVILVVGIPNIAQADTFSIGNDVYLTINLNKSSYTTGEQIYASGYAQSYSAAADTAYAQTETTGVSPVQFLYASITNGAQVYGYAEFPAPTTPGSYNTYVVGGTNSAPAGTGVYARFGYDMGYVCTSGYELVYIAPPQTGIQGGAYVYWDAALTSGVYYPYISDLGGIIYTMNGNQVDMRPGEWAC